MTNDPLADIAALEAGGIPRKQAETLIGILWEIRATAQADGVFDAIDAMRRLEASGFTRQQAEVLAQTLVSLFADARPRPLRRV